MDVTANSMPLDLNSSTTNVEIIVLLKYVKSPRQFIRISTLVRLLSTTSSSVYKRMFSTMMEVISSWPEYNSNETLQISAPDLRVPLMSSSFSSDPSSSSTASRRLLNTVVKNSQRSTRRSKFQKGAQNTRRTLDGSAQNSDTNVQAEEQNVTVDFFVRSHSTAASADEVLRRVVQAANKNTSLARMAVFSMYFSHSAYCQYTEYSNLQTMREILLPIVQEASENRVIDISPITISPVKFKSCTMRVVPEALGINGVKTLSKMRRLLAAQTTALPDTDRTPFLVEIVLYSDTTQSITLHSSPRLTTAGVFGIEITATQINTSLQVRVMQFTTNSAQTPNASAEPQKQQFRSPQAVSTLLIIVLSSVASISAICACFWLYHHLRVRRYEQDLQPHQHLLQPYHPNTLYQTNPQYQQQQQDQMKQLYLYTQVQEQIQA